MYSSQVLVLYPSHLVSYDRRFRTTIYHIIPRNQLALFEYPEISAYSHKLFEDHVNYVYLIYVLKGLLKSSHLQVLEKALTFIYYHVDFFNGSHRLLVKVSSLSLLLVVQRSDFPEFRPIFYSLE